MNDLSNNRTWRALAVSFLSVALASCGGDDGTAPETLRTCVDRVDMRTLGRRLREEM